MINLGTIELESFRLLLRRFNDYDYEDYYKGIASREECSEYFPWNPCNDLDMIKKRVQRWIKSYEDKSYYQWAIAIKDTNKFIGSINLHNVDADNNSAETSYLLNPNYWNRGIMSEALSLVIKFGFEELQLNRIYADYFAGNEASSKVLIKSGMLYEGTSRQKYYKNGKYIDSIQYSILAKEYFNKSLYLV